MPTAPAVLVELAEAVAAAVRAKADTLGRPVKVVRSYAPRYDLADLSQAKVSVVPMAQLPTALARGADDFEYTILVAVQHKHASTLTTDAAVNAFCDPLMKLVEDLVDLFRGLTPEAFPAARFAAVENAPVYDAPHLFEQQTFTSIITLRFKRSRPKA